MWSNSQNAGGCALAGEDEIGELAGGDPAGHATLPDQGIRADFTLSGHALEVLKGDRSGMGSALRVEP